MVYTPEELKKEDVALIVEEAEQDPKKKVIILEDESVNILDQLLG